MLFGGNLVAQIVLAIILGSACEPSDRVPRSPR